MCNTQQAPPASAILETCLAVADLTKARDFYSRVFGYSVIASDDRFCAFGAGEQQILILFVRGSDPDGTTLPFGMIPAHDASGRAHVGFRISASSLPAWKAHLAKQNIAIESSFTWPRGGTSVYFRDPDGHLLEVLTPGVWPMY
jgi:catechol 2,3-dioxygenase-like lactoylglutathione lyase family enzyme